MALFGSLNDVVFGIGTLALVALAVYLVRKRLAPVVVGDADSVVAVSAAIIAVYGLILGLTLAAAWERYQRADETLVNELNSIFILHRMADMWQGDGEDDLQRALVEYGEAVYANELSGKSPSHSHGANGRAALSKVYAAMAAITTGPHGDYSSVNNMWERLSDIDSSRGIRLTLTHEALPTQFWTVLYLGGAISLLALVMIHPANGKLHFLFSLGAAALIVITLVLLHDLDAPLEGKTTIDFDAFRRGMDILKETTPGA